MIILTLFIYRIIFSLILTLIWYCEHNIDFKLSFVFDP